MLQSLKNYPQKPNTQATLSKKNIFPQAVGQVEYVSNYVDHYRNHQAIPPSSKATRYDLINKNYIFPQEQFIPETNYTGSYKNNAQNRVRTEKVTYPDNNVLPKGKFEGNSNYSNDYVNQKGMRRELMKHEGQLKLGGRFQGQSNYTENYLNNGSPPKQEKIKFNDHRILPQGKFSDISTYGGHYIQNPVQNIAKIKPQGELKVNGGVFSGQSSYLAQYNNKQRVINERVKQTKNDVFPNGRFDGGSTYDEAYIKNQIFKNAQFKPEGQLKIGGQFYGESNYAQNYFDKGLGPKKQKHFNPKTQITPEGRFEDGTTYGGNYIANPIQKNEQIKPQSQLKVGGGKFEGLSNYGAEYIKKDGASKNQRIIHPQNDVMPKGKFVGNSTYIDAYIPGQLQHHQQFRPQGQLKIGGKFEGNSSYAADYQQYQGINSKREKAQFAVNQIMPKGQFQGNSTYQANYLQNQHPTPSKQIKMQQQLQVGGQFYGQSNYAQNYNDKGFSGRREKAILPQNKIMPEGKFEEGTTYSGNYIQNPYQKNIQFKPEGQLKVNVGQFDAISSYNTEYFNKEGQGRQQKVSYPANDVLPKGKFAGNSTYEDTYIPTSIEKHQQYRPEANLKVGGKFEGNTNYSQNYDGKMNPPRYLNKQGEYQRK